MSQLQLQPDADEPQAIYQNVTDFQCYIDAKHDYPMVVVTVASARDAHRISIHRASDGKLIADIHPYNIRSITSLSPNEVRPFHLIALADY
jgi:hypothetical protein